MQICAVDFACTNSQNINVFRVGHGGCGSGFGRIVAARSLSIEMSSFSCAEGPVKDNISATAAIGAAGMSRNYGWVKIL